MKVIVNTGSVIAAGSVVTKNVPAYSVVAGVPAVVIRHRFEGDLLEEHKRIINSTE
jgi:acetyltransferase-like isoleucine patch superfamily enzyme